MTRAFVDTNILVYVFDGRVKAKQTRAAQLLEELADGDEAPVLSTQVLQEAFVALTRKVHMEASDALNTLQLVEEGTFTVQAIDARLIWRAAARVIKDRLSFFDALIVESALEADCSVLYSEDLQSGRIFDGMTIVNPFN